MSDINESQKTSSDLMLTLLGDVERARQLEVENRVETTVLTAPGPLTEERQAFENVRKEHFPATDMKEFLRRDHEFLARQYVRAAFAMIEGITFTFKNLAREMAEAAGIELSPGELDFALERDFKLTDTGIIKEQKAMIRLPDNIRFTIALLQKVDKERPPFDANVAWWSDMMASIKVRHRLMHPKSHADLDISYDEVDRLADALAGLVMTYFPKDFMDKWGAKVTPSSGGVGRSTRTPA